VRKARGEAGIVALAAKNRPALPFRIAAAGQLFVENSGGTYYILGLPACSVL
jgi:hypothetical protein